MLNAICVKLGRVYPMNPINQQLIGTMYQNSIFETVKLSLFELFVRLSVLISLRNLSNSLKSIKEEKIHNEM